MVIEFRGVVFSLQSKPSGVLIRDWDAELKNNAFSPHLSVVKLWLNLFLVNLIRSHNENYLCLIRLRLLDCGIPLQI